MILGCFGLAQAQYDIKQLADFEDGKLPANSHVVGKGAEQNVLAVDLGTIAGMPSQFRSPRAVRETQNRALLIRAIPGADPKASYVAGLTIGDPLDRNQLGDKGRAIYQADFFIADSNLPTLAVLAKENEGQGTDSATRMGRYYRFGFLSSEEVFFSLVDPGTSVATVLKKNAAFLKEMPRPGWHRFAMVFEGQDRIRCLIDGRELPFSPITDTRLQRLSVGVLAACRSRAYDCYVDNLSIQFTSEAEVLPISPYSSGWTMAAAEPVSLDPGIPSLSAVGTVQQGGAEQWLEPEAAWAQAQSARKPFLLYFSSPGAGATVAFETILRSNTDAQALLKRSACSRVDVNQLQGGMIARKYGVFKVPTVLLVSPDAKDHRRATFPKGGTWEEFKAQLKGI
jgi:hypothetical protein